MANFWHDSTALRWEEVTHDGQTLYAEASSRRAPFRQRWIVSPDDAGIRIRVMLDTLEDMTLQEYHASLMLPGSFQDWRTGHEEGTFPEIPAEQSDWMHLNSNYEPGKWIEARGGGAHVVTLSVMQHDTPFRMTPLNTAHRYSARVLQALRVPPGGGGLKLPAGEHCYFDGRIDVIAAGEGAPGNGEG